MTATSRASPTRATDRGMVTVEAAVSLCAFVTVLAMALAGTSMVLAEIRCTDAAREAARLVARGEANRAADAVDRIAPRAVLSVTTEGDGIRVTVRDPDTSGLLPGVHVGADAYAVAEPDAADSEPEPTGPPIGAGPSAGAGPDQPSRPTGGDRR